MDRARAGDIFGEPAREALKAFPLEPDSVEIVTVSENATFRVVDAAHGDHVLRLHRPGYHTLAELESERLWTQALRQAGISAPHAVAAVDGRHFVPVAVPALDETRYAGVARWTAGEVLSLVMADETQGANLPRWFEQLGQIQAAMHNQSSAWRAPEAFTRHHLDCDGLLGEAPFWGRFWESPVFAPQERAAVLATRERLRSALQRYGKSATTYSVIHADLHPGNILIDGGRLSVIDFDDSGFGWHMYDAAVVLFYHQQSDAFPVLRDAFFRGYRATRALSDQDEAMLPLFLLIRGMAQIGWFHQRPELSGAHDRAAVQRTKNLVCRQCAVLTPHRSLA
jgi:Ser/Thr protein kinase RdoA (MazF antagonist)